MKNRLFLRVTLFLLSILYPKSQDTIGKDFFAAYKSSRFDRRRLPLLPLAATGVNTAIVDENRRVFPGGRKKTTRSLPKCTAAIAAASDFSTHALFFYFFPPPPRLPKETSRSISDNDATDITPTSSSRALYSFSRYQLLKKVAQSLVKVKGRNK